MDHRLARLTAGVDVTRDTHAVTEAIDSMLGILARMPNIDELRSEQLIGRLARTFESKPDRLLRRLDFLRQEESRRRSMRRRPPSPSPSPSLRPTTVRGGGGVAVDPNALLDQSAASELDVSADWQRSSADQAERPRVLSPPSGLDRELFETLIEDPDLAAMAVESIDADWLSSATAQMLLSAYQDLDLAGKPLDAAALLLVIENESLKNIVVTLIDRTRDRPEPLSLTPPERFTALVTRYRERELTAERHRQIRQLESASLPEDQELALLQAMFEQEKGRHQIKTRP